MRPPYHVHALDVGTLTVDRSSLLYMRGFGVATQVPIIMWVIRSADDIVIVDTGAPPPEFTLSHHHVPMTQAEAQRPHTALHNARVDPGDVSIVIISHLHYDHAANNALFPRASFWVQSSELAYARTPLPVHARGYEHPTAGFERTVFDGTSWTVVKGDEEIAPGLRVVLTPGHTPGLQAVAVDTVEGPVVLASDNVPLYENWSGEPPLVPHIPSGGHIDLRECFSSFRRLEAMEGRILPSHDRLVFEAASLRGAHG